MSTSQEVNVEIKTKSNGEQVKVTTTTTKSLVTQKVNKNVYERSKLPKFNRGKEMAESDSITTYSVTEAFELRCTPVQRVDESDQVTTEVERIAGSTHVVVCSNCGEPGHFSLKCPKRKEINNSGKNRAQESESRDEEEYSVKLSNLSELASDMAVRDLVDKACFRAGIMEKPTRVFVVKDKDTNRSRGFGFVAFNNLADAEKLIDTLDNHGFDSLIIHAEMAAQRKRPDDSEFRSWK